MRTGLLVGILVLFGVFLLLAVIGWVYSVLRRKLEREIKERFDKDQVLGATIRANFFGQRSKGRKQVRGNGALVLTRNELFFKLAVPAREYLIPMTSVKEVSMPRSFNGKSILTRLLCVEFEVNNQRDAIAWAVKAPESWKAAIDRLLEEQGL